MRSDDPRHSRDAFSSPRMVVIVLLLFTLVAGILGVANGNITLDKLLARPAVASDPITIP